MIESQTRAKRFLQLVRCGPLVPVGPPLDATILDGPDETETSVQFLDTNERTVLGYLVVKADGTLAYESLPDAESGQEEGERMVRKANAEVRYGAPSPESAALHLASGSHNFYCNPRWEIIEPVDNVGEGERHCAPSGPPPSGLTSLGRWLTTILLAVCCRRRQG